jgi:YD repeat-containing protein
MSRNKPIYEYDSNGNLIHRKYTNGYEEWWEYDFNGKCVHYKDSTGFKQWWEYDTNGKFIYTKTSDGEEIWYWEGQLTKDPIKILLLSTQVHSKASQ